MNEALIVTLALIFVGLPVTGGMVAEIESLRSADGSKQIN